MLRKFGTLFNRYMNWVTSVQPKWISMTVCVSSFFIFGYASFAIIFFALWLLYVIPFNVVAIIIAIPVIYAWIKALFFQKGK